MFWRHCPDPKWILSLLGPINLPTCLRSGKFCPFTKPTHCGSTDNNSTSPTNHEEKNNISLEEILEHLALKPSQEIDRKCLRKVEDSTKWLASFRHIALHN